jgi:hypothetical protein
MSDDKDLDFTIGVDVDVEKLQKDLEVITRHVERASKKLGQTLDEHINGVAKKSTKSSKKVKETFLQSLEGIQFESKKSITSFSDLLTVSTQKFKNFFNENSSELNGFIKKSFGGLSTMAGALGIGLTGSAFVKAIGDNAQLGYKSGGLHTTPNKLSAFQQGARQVGIDAGETDQLFARIAQMQTDQFSPDAVVASQAMQYLTRVNTLLGITNKNGDGSEKQTNKYILDILQSQSLRTLTPLAQEGMLQKALGVSTVTAHQLLQPNLLPAIKKAETTTATTDKEAEEAIKADQSIQDAKNSIKKGFAWGLHALNKTSEFIGNAGAYYIGAMNKDFMGAILGHTNAYDNTTSKVASNRMFGLNEQTGQYSNDQINAVAEKINQKTIGQDVIGALINNPQLTNAQRMKESGGYNFAIGSHGELGAFQLMPKTANEIGGKEYTADELFDYDTNKMLRDKYLRQGMERALQYANKNHMQLSQEQLVGSGLAYYNGGYGGMKHYMQTGGSYNGYAEDIMQKANVNLTQNITINGVDTKDAGKIVSAVKSVNKKDWLSLQLNNTRAYQN